MTRSGFTFVEVLVAMLILVLAIVSAVDMVRGSVRSTRNTKIITEATWLLQNVMTELETKLETLGFETGCEEKAEASFEEPYEDYSWTTYCSEIDFKISEAAAQLASQGAENEGAPTRENPILKQIITIANNYISEAARELHAEVSWLDGKSVRNISLTTHVVNLDLPFSLPNIGALQGGGSNN